MDEIEEAVVGRFDLFPFLLGFLDRPARDLDFEVDPILFFFEEVGCDRVLVVKVKDFPSLDHQIFEPFALTNCFGGEALLVVFQVCSEVHAQLFSECGVELLCAVKARDFFFGFDNG